MFYIYYIKNVYALSTCNIHPPDWFCSPGEEDRYNDVIVMQENSLVPRRRSWSILEWIAWCLQLTLNVSASKTPCGMCVCACDIFYMCSMYVCPMLEMYVYMREGGWGKTEPWRTPAFPALAVPAGHLCGPHCASSQCQHQQWWAMERIFVPICRLHRLLGWLRTRAENWGAAYWTLQHPVASQNVLWGLPWPRGSGKPSKDPPSLPCVFILKQNL